MSVIDTGYACPCTRPFEEDILCVPTLRPQAANVSTSFDIALAQGEPNRLTGAR